jgi:hypothetical protein
MPHFITDKSLELFTKHSIFTKEEILSRYEILLENYAKTIHIESLTLQEMVRKDFTAGLVRYMKDITNEALKKKDLDTFFAGILASGRSSFCYLQNVYTCKNLSEQGLSFALCLAEKTLSGKRAAWRVHGGGFAGTIQAFVPNEDVAEFRRVMDEALGEGCCMVLRIRPVGAVKI